MKRSCGALVPKTGERGQSLVEVALFMPIFIVILAGLVEISQIVIGQNRVSNAARTGTRFMANGGDDIGMLKVTLNSITQTLDQSEAFWDVWSIEGVVNDQGDGFVEWEFSHIFGISNTSQFGQVNEAAIQTQVLQQLQNDLAGSGPSVAANLHIVGTFLIHDVDSLLGLDAIPWLSSFNSVRALSVMRKLGFNFEATQGCDAFPIAVHEGIRSVTPPGQGANPFPDQRDFGNSSPTPKYTDFLDHVDNVPLADAKEGYIFKIQNGFGTGNFGWLRWNIGRPDDAETLHDSLTWPGNSKQYAPPATGGQGLPIHGRVHGFVEPNDVTDISINIGDMVAANTGSINSRQVRDTLNEHIALERVLRVIVWSNSTQQGNTGEYEVSGFALVRLHGYNLSGNQSWILAEFIRPSNSCGQLDQ